MKLSKFHDKARKTIREFSTPIKQELGDALLKLQLGMNLGLPISRPMPSVYQGAQELRFRDPTGIQRVFYYTKCEGAILVFHAFVKKTQRTPQHEIELGRKRLMEMISNET